MMPAPARLIPVSVSMIARSRSSQPRAAAPVPVAAYQVSGEYAMIEAAAAATCATMSR